MSDKDSINEAIDFELTRRTFKSAQIHYPHNYRLILNSPNPSAYSICMLGIVMSEAFADWLSSSWASSNLILSHFSIRILQRCVIQDNKARLYIPRNHRHVCHEFPVGVKIPPVLGRPCWVDDVRRFPLWAYLSHVSTWLFTTPRIPSLMEGEDPEETPVRKASLFV